jgi:hypothetical protein
MSDDLKFERDDLPKILAALKTAKDAGVDGIVTVAFSHDGGVKTILYDSKKRFK